MATLDSWLNAAYGASIGRKGLVMSVIEQDFKKSLQQDPSLLSDSVQKLSELNATHSVRGEPCVFSKIHREFLQETLNG